MASRPEITKRTQIWRMNVQPLKDALEDRGLDSTGDKTDLQNRLFAWFDAKRISLTLQEVLLEVQFVVEKRKEGAKQLS